LCRTDIHELDRTSEMSWIDIQSCAGQTDMNWTKQLDMGWADRQAWAGQTDRIVRLGEG